ncbi:hypothetical protein [Rummeliibacillus sp. SL167]|uniref:hypothetical protein n=1 Tax=Rummeliibacillus sp. SL167 TaxID=2579792 RepID=UPI0011B75D69|nr:hypothetical protein [Rummeliibacillus sp. SL167]
MKNKFRVSQILVSKETQKIEKIYAVNTKGEPFDLLEIGILEHFHILTKEQVQEKLDRYKIGVTFKVDGQRTLLTLNSKEDANLYIEHIGPYFNEVLL